MKIAAMILIAALLVIGGNLYAANGDLVVSGGLQVDGTVSLINSNTTSTIAEGISYYAQTDGFLVGTVIVSAASQQGVQRIEGYTGNSNPPTKAKGYASVTGHIAAQWATGMAGSFTIPVRKGEYYKTMKVDAVGSIISTRTYYFIPLGN